MKNIKLQVVVMTVLVAVMVSALLPVQASGEGNPHTIMIPIGRTVLSGENDFSFTVDGEPIDVSVVYDEYGGYWAEIPFDLERNEEIVFQVTRVRGSIGLFEEPGDDPSRWLEPSPLIDSDDSVLSELASELTADVDTNDEKARIISDFVIAHLRFEPFLGHFLFSASQTYGRGHGSCVNFARLFVALSRAAGLPARTVWGVVRNTAEYDYHHEWAEYLDDEGYWHPADFTFTRTLDLSDVRYLDLIYSAEENPWYEYLTTEYYSPSREQLYLVDSVGIPYDGRMGFVIVENRYPGAFVLENRFYAADIPDLLPQRLP
jgi:transglutaminase-like putative cysteine protease